MSGLFGQPKVPTIAPHTAKEIQDQAITRAKSDNQSLLQAVAQQNRYGFRQQATTGGGVGPVLGPGTSGQPPMF